MAEKKEICLTFLYADEGIFDYMNSEGRLTKMIDWADQFFGQYDLKLNIHPTTFNLKKYKEDYCHKKSNGQEYIIWPMDDTPFGKGWRSLLTEFIHESILEAFYVDKEITRVKREDSSNLTLLADLKQQHDDLKLQELSLTALKEFLESNNTEKKIRSIVDNYRIALDRERIPVLFINFIDLQLKWGGDLSIGQTFEKKFFDHYNVVCKDLPKYGAIMKSRLTYSVGRKTMGALPFRSIVILDPEESTSFGNAGVLGHEIVHCLHSSTKDDEGGKDSIMNYKDLFANAKTPTKLKLDKDDEAKLKTAYFVK